MTSKVTNADLMNVLLDIKGQTGEMKAHIEATTGRLEQHIEDDKVVLETVQTLQLSAARQKGFLAALSSFGALLGGGVGYIVERILLEHH